MFFFINKRIDLKKNWKFHVCVYFVLRPNSGNCPVSMMDNSVPLSVSPLGEGSNALSGGQSRSYQRTASPDTYASKTSDFYSAFPNTAYPTAFKSTGRALNPPSGTFPTLYVFHKVINDIVFASRDSYSSNTGSHFYESSLRDFIPKYRFKVILCQ